MKITNWIQIALCANILVVNILETNTKRRKEMKKTKKWISVISVLSMLIMLLLTGCGGSNNDKSNKSNGGKGNAAEEKTMVIPVMNDISSFYTVGTDDLSSQVISPGFDNLFTVAGNGEINYYLAESCTLSDDGCVYTVKLREDATFSDGEPVTADDLVFSMSSDQADFMQYYPYFACSGVTVKKIDDLTVSISIEKPNNGFIQRIGTCRVMPSHLYDGAAGEEVMACEGAMSGVGCGPYKMTEWKKGESITYEKRDNYYGNQPDIDKIVFKVMPDASAQELAFKNGEISMLRLSSKEQLEEYSADEAYTVFNFPEQRVNFLTVNASSKIITSAESRQAIIAGVNPQEIVDQVYGSDELAKVAGGMYVNATEYFDTSMENYTYDQELAKKLVKESGLDGQKLTLLYFTDRENMEKYAMVIQQQLKAIGVECEIVGEDIMSAGVKWQSGTDEYDLVLNGWDNMQGNPGFEWAYYSDGSADAFYCFSEDTLNAIKTAISATEDEQITEEWQKAQKSFYEDYWAYPLIETNYVLAAQKGFEGLDANEIVPVFDDWTAITYK